MVGSRICPITAISITLFPTLLRRRCPAKVDLRPGCPKIVYDQGQIGSCTANAIAGAIEFDRIKQGLPAFTPSRLFIYYNERVMESTSPSVDSGAQIRDGVRASPLWVLAKRPPGHTATSTRTPRHVPLAPTRKRAVGRRCHRSGEIQDQDVPETEFPAAEYTQRLSCNLDIRFVFGFTVYESFESQQVAKTGIVPMPGAKGEGGRRSRCTRGWLRRLHEPVQTVRNSWGAGWGIKGYFTIPYLYLTNGQLADDFWAIQTV